MDKIKRISKKALAVFGFFVLIVILVFMLSATGNNSQQPTTPVVSSTPYPTPGVAPDWANLEKAAISVSKDANAVKGIDGEKLFPSKSLSRQNSIEYKDGTAALVKQIVTVDEGKKGASIRKTLGDPEVKLYGPEAEGGAYLYAYPTKGVGYIANEVTDTIYELWYFDPTDLPTFEKTWAKDYSEKFTPQGL